MSVQVSVETSSALVETGEHRSPKKTPERIEPPVKTGLIPSAEAIVAQTTPIVAAVPNEVPVKKDMAQLSRNVIRRKMEGRISLDA